jgi:hypothetical protein
MRAATAPEKEREQRAARRAAHFIDVENLVGSGRLESQMVHEAFSLYQAAVQVGAKDVVLVAAGVHNRRAVIEGWPRAYYQFRSGKDGADLALINFFHEFDVMSSVGRVIIGSGDNRFAEVAHFATAHGIPVDFVTYRGAMSYKLRGFRSINLSESIQR